MRWQLKPTLYLAVLLAVIAGAYGFHVRQDGIFACPAQGYRDNYYLGYCQGSAYGDYDHGAIWFGLEPGVRESAAAADVLFVGSSRLMFGFSTAALERWFGAEGSKYFLLGFSHVENVNFIGPLLRDLKPTARAYVINLDSFFDRRLTPPAHTVMREPDARERYLRKQAWQWPHRLACDSVPALCKAEISFFRHRETGAWRLGGTSGLAPSAIETELPVDSAALDIQAPRAQRMLDDLGFDRRCIILTYLPPRESERATAAALASRLGLPFVSPQLAGFRTFDGSHLDGRSAERFVNAFLEAAGPRLRSCLRGSVSAVPRQDVAGARFAGGAG